jgi:hypothetical protein
MLLFLDIRCRRICSCSWKWVCDKLSMFARGFVDIGLNGIVVLEVIGLIFLWYARSFGCDEIGNGGSLKALLR